MGIHDREYYRSEGSSYLGTFAQNGLMCKRLIMANLIVFVIQLMTFDPTFRPGSRFYFGEFTTALWFDPGLVMEGQVWRMFTCAFLHDIGWAHILFNMLFLWWFGHVIEGIYGPREFLTMYVVAIFASSTLQLLSSLATGQMNPALGASGAVTAVMVIFAFHFPHHRILLWFVIPVPIWLFVGFQVAQDTFIFLNPVSRQATETAVAAHLGGALFGFLYFQNQWKLSSWWTEFQEWKKRRSRPKLRVYHEEEPEPVPISAPVKDSNVDEHLEAQVDAVLEKLSKVGRENLTDEEKEILKRASEIYRDKRN